MDALAKLRREAHMAAMLSNPEREPTAGTSRLIVAEVLELLDHAGISVTVRSACETVYFHADVDDTAPIQHSFAKADCGMASFHPAHSICRLAWALIHTDFPQEAPEGALQLDPDELAQVNEAIDHLRQAHRNSLPKMGDED